MTLNNTEEQAGMNQHIEGHTVQRYDGEMNHLHLLVLEMGGLVAEQVQAAVKALRDKDVEVAKRIVEKDHDVNALEIKTDEEIVSVIARRCPVARDLRTIIAMSKSVADLERIGDEAAKIAKMAVAIYDNDRSDPSGYLLRDIHTVGNLAISMLRQSLDAFDQFDVEKAEEVAQGRSELDAEFQSSVRRLATFIMEDSRNVGHAINIVVIIKSLERIGDHARNIAEYVVYLIEGTDIRHQAKEFLEGRPASGAG